MASRFLPIFCSFVALTLVSGNLEECISCLTEGEPTGCYQAVQDRFDREHRPDKHR